MDAITLVRNAHDACMDEALQQSFTTGVITRDLFNAIGILDSVLMYLDRQKEDMDNAARMS